MGASRALPTSDDPVIVSSSSDQVENKPPSKTDAPRQQLNNVDLLRGLAALAVLIWHYRHFGAPSDTEGAPGTFVESLPFQSLAPAVYEHGALAVQLFWLLSGFIFFYVYASRRNLGFREFAVNRFSRLYPLHFITLIAVVVLQFANLHIAGHAQIYSESTPLNFLLNVLFLQGWFFGQAGLTYNGPTWSVSIELAAYAIFILAVRHFRARAAFFIGWFLVSLWIYRTTDPETFPAFFAQCSMLFVVGGFIQKALFALRGSWQLIISTALGVIGFAVAVVIAMQREELKDSIATVMWVLFPSALIVAASLDRLGLSANRLGRFFGNITYASYLIHVPFQLLLLLVLDATHTSRTVAQTHWFFIMFMAGVVLLSTATYRYIEIPGKRWTKRLLTK